MSKVIVYKDPKSAQVCLMKPNLECDLSLSDIAKKDTPFQTPYLIVNESDLPTDLTYIEAWEIDFTSPDGYGLGPHRFFIEKAIKDIRDPRVSDAKKEEATKLIAQMKAEVLTLEGVTL